MPDGCVYRALYCQPAASCQYSQYCQHCSIIRGQQIGYLRAVAYLCLSSFLMILLTSSWYPISSDFGANLAPIWPPTWAQNRSKIVPRALRNPSQIASCFRSLFGSILDRFLIDFRAQNQSKTNQKSINKSSQQHNNQKSKKCQKCNTYATFGTSAMLRWVQNSIKINPTSIKKQLPNQHPNLNRFWCQLGSILGPFWEPSWGQVGTKSLRKSIQQTIKNMITFWIALETDFDRFWAPTWPPKGETNLWFLEHFGHLVSSWGQDPPKTPPRGPKTPQEPPRPPQETPPRPLQEASWDRFWKDCGFQLDGFWSQLGWFVGWSVRWLASHLTTQPPNQSSNHPDNQTTRQPDNQTTRQPDSRTSLHP